MTIGEDYAWIGFMKNIKYLLILFVVAGASFLAFNTYYSINKVSPEKMTCLSALVPPVVLHYQQDDIVRMLQDLAKSNNETLPEDLKEKPIQPVISERVDKELLSIGHFFQLKSQNALMEEASILSTVKLAINYLRKDAPEFLTGCLSQLQMAKEQCGTIDNPNEKQQLCLESHSEKIQQLIPKPQI